MSGTKPRARSHQATFQVVGCPRTITHSLVVAEPTHDSAAVGPGTPTPTALTGLPASPTPSDVLRSYSHNSTPAPQSEQTNATSEQQPVPAGDSGPAAHSTNGEVRDS